jgi:two-component system phosphate regulon sensor histidine kinase PhoR
MYWPQFRLKSQLRKVLNAAPDTSTLSQSFSTSTLIRREILYLQEQIQLRDQRLAIYEQLIEDAPLGFLRIDSENHLLWCNQQAQKWLNIDRWQPNRLRLLLELVRSYDLDRLIVETRQTGKNQVAEWNFYPKITFSPPDRNLSSLLYASSSLRLKGYGYPLPQGEVGVFIENQQSLQEFSQKRDRFFSDLTHELRTPLTSLSLLAETLEKRLDGDEKRWSRQILTEIGRLMQLVQDWLDLASIQENPYQSLQFQPIAINTIIKTAWQSLEPLAHKKSITLSCPDLNCPDLNISTLEGDPVRLTQVFLNLFDNSIKHSPTHSQIQIQVERPEAAEPPQLTLHLIDQGSGFLAQDLPHIFDRLYRGDPARARDSSDPTLSRPGSGLGLAIAKEIIQAHGGTIQAFNHPETQGAWLTITLPLTQLSTPTTEIFAPEQDLSSAQKPEKKEILP